MGKLVHHHLIYQAEVGRDFGGNDEKILKDFLNNLLKEINMNCLIPAQLKLSHQNAWTGIMGIITSHIAFHYFINERYVQLDIYSCKEFDKKKAVKFINNFWKAENVKALFINREVGKDFDIERIE